MMLLAQKDVEPFITLGSWPDWVAAVATSIALLIAAISYAESIKDRRRVQARLVYATAELVFTIPQDGPIMNLPDPERFRMGQMVRSRREGTDSRGRPIRIAEEPGIGIDVRVHNMSDELIFPIRLYAMDVAHGAVHDDRVMRDNDPLRPHSDKAYRLVVTGKPGLAQNLRPVIVFRDSSGQWWRRTHAEPIELLRRDPFPKDPRLEQWI
ncbi:hypothetical protein [Microbacterium sp. E-13]|uniref:hypothetical protein n=1 Tax=Microbacterium sp. E-13 TaxID=3404048 RepID=UPI003CF264F6